MCIVLILVASFLLGTPTRPGGSQAQQPAARDIDDMDMGSEHESPVDLDGPSTFLTKTRSGSPSKAGMRSPKLEMLLDSPSQGKRRSGSPSKPSVAKKAIHSHSTSVYHLFNMYQLIISLLQCQRIKT